MYNLECLKRHCDLGAITSYAVFTNRINIGKLYTVLNPLYSLLRFSAIKKKHCLFQLV